MKTDDLAAVPLAVSYGLLSGRDIRNHVFVSSGSLSVTRYDFSRLIEEMGGTFHTSVTHSTNYLVVPDDYRYTAKVGTAVELGVTILTESQFCSLIVNYTL